MHTVSPTYAGRVETGRAADTGTAGDEPVWTGRPPLLRMRRLLLVWLGLSALGLGLGLVLLVRHTWAVSALVPLVVMAWGRALRPQPGLLAPPGRGVQLHTGQPKWRSTGPEVTSTTTF